MAVTNTTPGGPGGTPQFRVDPNGNVWERRLVSYGPLPNNPMMMGPQYEWVNTGPSRMLTGEFGGSASGAMGGLAGVAGGGGGYPTGDDTAAETAARTSSKENAALRLQAGLKGLRNVMASRGISQSGLFADEAGQLFADSNAEEAATDRDIIGRRATRSAQIADRNFNANTQLEIARMNAASNERNRVSNLLLQFGMRY